MIDDPEGQAEEWTQEVFADSEEEADRKCQTIAANATEEGRTVVIVLGNPQKVGRRKYICRFRGETSST